MGLNVIASANAGTTGAGLSTSLVGEDGMKRFWAQAVNAVLIPLGQLLSSLMEDGRTAAEHLADGLTVTVDTVEGMPVNPAFTALRIVSGAKWLCPACGSAHGTKLGVSASKKAGASKTPKVAGLLKNEWYYRPADGALFTI